MKHFAKDYSHAREMFLHAAKQRGAQRETHESEYVGFEGEKLYTDTALLAKGDEKILLVITSATHGVEGFAGSAIQTGLLREGFPQELTAGIAVLMIHAVNPYGFSHLRRFNEKNIDINRNFVNHPFTYPNNTGHAYFKKVLAPEKLNFLLNIRLILKILFFYLHHGAKVLFQAIGCGQNTFPKSLYYGGTTDSWSTGIIKSVVKTHAASVETLTIVDFHTGIGRFGKADILIDSGHPCAYSRAKRWWPNFNVPDNTNKAKITGSLTNKLFDMFPEKTVTAATIEFGTQYWWQKLSLISLFALRNENWLFHFGGDNHPDYKKIKRKLKNCFSPDNKQWQSKVWDQGRKIVFDALKGMQ